ncbi:putative DMT superfamily transporter inner membrane protein [Variovorax sp. SRS16]|uniref:DMT family transporter n=1 Tax=Variovorax sp. SRS16 TaxID=282217 RepID=UPI001316A600|nr:EamA family transporter [Variovorax sp. SRS16]VTU24690.1 putative DMT superfamily transporter inner membrane protein [Variovorax sp. SRS16]
MSEGECATAGTTIVGSLTQAPGAARPARSAWLVDLLLLASLWGASFLFMRIGAAEFGALPTAAVRVAIAALFLLPLLFARGQWPALRQRWKPALALGILNCGLPFAFFSFALLTVNSGLAAVLNATTPMFGALVAWAFFGDRPGGSRSAGLVAGFAGVAMLAWRSAGFHSGADPTAALWAIAACLGACICYAFGASLTRKHLTGVPALATATGNQIGATLLLALPAWWLWPAHMPSLHAWLALVAVGTACTGLAYVLYFRLIESAGPARALTVTFLVPVFALFYGAVFLDEQITPWMLVCAAVIVCGVALSTGMVVLGRRRPAAATASRPPPR